jgi:hypothetical protein
VLWIFDGGNMARKEELFFLKKEPKNFHPLFFARDRHPHAPK